MKTMIISEGQSLMDVCIGQYGSVEGFVKLCKESGVSPDGVLTAGAQLAIDDTAVFKPIISTLNDSKAQEANTIISEGQSLVDVCIQEYGSIQSLLKVALKNGLDFNTNPSPGNKLNVNPNDIVRKQLVKYFKKNSTRVNTGLLPGGAGEVNEGIFDFTFDFSFE